MLTLQYLAELVAAHRDVLDAKVATFSIGNRLFDFNRHPALMGVVNLSSDSWYRESVALSIEAAVQRGRVLTAQGADLIDLGAESTLAHAARADASAQNQRLLPVIRELYQAGVRLSVETYEPEVAAQCLGAGAQVLNLTGNLNPDRMFRLAVDHDAAVILCYVQGDHVRAVSDFDFGADPIEAMRVHFERAIEAAHRANLQKLILDPGLGFYYRNLQDSALRIRHQISVFLNTFRLRSLGYPICHALPHAFECFREEVRSAEPFFAVLAALGRTNLFRTHEVSRVKAVLDTMSTF